MRLEGWSGEVREGKERDVHPSLSLMPTLTQLVDHPFIKPSAIHSHELLEGYATEYLYLGCIKFVKQVGQRVGRWAGGWAGGWLAAGL